MVARAATLNRPVVAFDRDAMLEAARAMVPVLAAREAAAILAHDVPAETIDDFRRANFFRITQPRRFGGIEAPFELFSQIVEQLTFGCAASAWVYAVLGEHQWIVASFPEQAQLEVWGSDEETLVSSSLAPRATARKVDGGFRLTGRYPFSSGSSHAQWAIVGAFCEQADALPAVKFMLIPLSDLEIVDDWQTLGLRATGSRSLALDDVFIPEHRTIWQRDMDQGTTPGRAVHPDFALLRAPRGLFALYSQPPVVISLGARALAMVVDKLRDRVSLGQFKMADSEDVQIRLAECAAEVEIAQLILRTDRERATAIHMSGRRITSRDTIPLRRNIVFAQRQIRNALQRLLDINGVGWVYDGDPLQPIIRDVQVALGHVAASWTMGMRPDGRMRLGVDPVIEFG